MDALFTLDTGAGFWNPLLWVLGAAVAGVIALVLYSLGEEGLQAGHGPG